MEMTEAIAALAALAQETRLTIYRLLVEAGPEGLAAGKIGEELDLPPATLSFHLAQLARTGLAKSRQDGRFVIYSADFESMNVLVGSKAAYRGDKLTRRVWSEILDGTYVAQELVALSERAISPGVVLKADIRN
jgi:DNA-binding transcriptional ArsR family regulator